MWLSNRSRHAFGIEGKLAEALAELCIQCSCPVVGILRSLAALMGPFVAGAWRTDVLVAKQKIKACSEQGPRPGQLKLGSVQGHPESSESCERTNKSVNNAPSE